MHVFIIGNSGSGKSTLAAHLSKHAGLRHVDLDTVAWDEPGVRRDVDASVEALRATLEGPAVLEGMYVDIVEAAISPEDRLIWLDLPVESCLENCRARPHEPHKWPSAAAQDAFLPKLLDFVRGYDEREGPLGRSAAEHLFADFGGQTLRLTAMSQVAALTGA